MPDAQLETGEWYDGPLLPPSSDRRGDQLGWFNVGIDTVDRWLHFDVQAAGSSASFDQTAAARSALETRVVIHFVAWALHITASDSDAHAQLLTWLDQVSRPDGGPVPELGMRLAAEGNLPNVEVAGRVWDRWIEDDPYGPEPVSAVRVRQVAEMAAITAAAVVWGHRRNRLAAAGTRALLSAWSRAAPTSHDTAQELAARALEAARAAPAT